MSIFKPAILACIKKARRTTWWEFLGPDRDQIYNLGTPIEHNTKQTMCGLCGQSGIIDTRGHTFTPAGFECGVLRWCICPNGRSLKRRTHLEVPTDDHARRAREDRGLR